MLRATLVPASPDLPPLTLALARRVGVGPNEVELLRSATQASGGTLELEIPVQAGAELLLRVGTDAPAGALASTPGYDLIYRYD